MRQTIIQNQHRKRAFPKCETFGNRSLRVATGKEVAPLAGEKPLDIRQRRQRGPILARFQRLEVADADPRPFRQALLRPFSRLAQRGEISPKAPTLRATDWFFGRHRSTHFPENRKKVIRGFTRGFTSCFFADNSSKITSIIETMEAAESISKHELQEENFCRLLRIAPSGQGERRNSLETGELRGMPPNKIADHAEIFLPKLRKLFPERDRPDLGVLHSPPPRQQQRKACPLVGAEKSQYLCKFCGTKNATIHGLVNALCQRHPNGLNKGRHSPAL